MRVRSIVEATQKLIVDPIADRPDSLTDLLTALRHWADRVDVDFYTALDTSNIHYLAEKGKRK